MAYSQQSDLETYVGVKQLAELTNDTANATTPDATVVAAMIAKADNEIDSQVGQVFAVPFVAGTNCTSIPSSIMQISVTLAAYYCFLRRFGIMAIPANWLDSAKQARQSLIDISDMKVFLDGNPTVLSSEVLFNAPAKKVNFDDTDNPMSLF